MRVTEQQLRTVTLAQAIEHADAGRTLVSQLELDDATRAAIGAARQRGVQRVDVGDIVLDRAAAIAERASGRDAVLAALQPAGGRPRWLTALLPAGALLLGLAIDRIANAHRVDLLSPPLLLVLAWNLVMYALLAVRALRPWRHRAGGPRHGALLQALRQAAHRQLRSPRRGLAARIAADFHLRWQARSANLTVQRAARVLHLCAAAWAAGIALSLLLRGLVVRYQFGWESTFLDAGQVHAIVSVLFWPLTSLWGLVPFSLQDIAATQNFAGHGQAGSRWVWMYVGLLALVVVLPRLALAAWAHWRAARLARHCHLDLSEPAFDALRQALPGDLVVGLQGRPAQCQAWTAIAAAQATAQGAVETPQGDRLRFVAGAAGAALPPVDAVLAWEDSASDAVPAAWQGTPVLALQWNELAASWVQEAALFDRLEAALPARRHALARLGQAWVQHNEARFEQSLQALAQHLRACAGLGSAGDHAAGYAQQVQALDTALRSLHTNGAAASQPAPGRGAPVLRRPDGTALALGTSAGAVAGAAAGAKVGALIDVGTGGLTLGAGTALGALLGGTTAWAVRAFQKKEAAHEVLLRVAEAACTRYLVIAHEGRVAAQEGAALADRWGAEVVAAVAAHGAELAAALNAGTAPTDALLPPLRATVLGILRRSFTPGPGAQAPRHPPSPQKP